MYGTDSSFPSRTIALCCVYAWLSAPDEPLSPATSRPRSYSAFVMSWNALPPRPRKPIDTCGAFVFWSLPAWMRDSSRSLPLISGGPPVRLGKYLKRYQYLPFGEFLIGCVAPVKLSVPPETTSRCAGTPRIV